MRGAGAHLKLSSARIEKLGTACGLFIELDKSHFSASPRSLRVGGKECHRPIGVYPWGGGLSASFPYEVRQG